MLYIIGKNKSQLWVSEFPFFFIRIILPYIGAIPAIRPKPRGRVAKGHWLEKKHVREFFIEYAQSMQFDPLEPTNWINIPVKYIVAQQVHCQKRKRSKS